MDIPVETLNRRSDYLLGMSLDDVAERRNFFGASDANTLLSGDADRINRMWLVHTGQAEPEDLSNILPVQMGVYTEDFNLHWFEKQTGRRVTDRKQKVIHPAIPFLRATLDGKTLHPDDETTACVVDAKHVSGFADEEETLKKYAPQLAVQMACTGAPYGLLSILFGNFKWAWIGLPRDALYEAQVISAIKVYWGHVKTQTPPVDIPGAEPPLPHSLMRSVDMTTSNSWSVFEGDYLNCEAQAKTFETAKKELKSLVEADVKEAKGKLITVKRGKDGSLRFSRSK